MNNRRANLWLGLTILYSLSTFVLSSFSRIPKFLNFARHSDWILHGIEYGILAILLMNYNNESEFINKRAAPFFAFVFCGFVGAMNELWQARVPHRSATLGDGIANLVGVLVFLGFHFLVGKYKKKNPIIL